MAKPPIDIEELLTQMHRVCGDTAFTKRECLDAYEEVAAVAENAAGALSEEIEGEEMETGAST